jgi:hypothetical protein
MRRLFWTTVAVLAIAGRAADAHQLDEYLQAARIAIAQDHLVVEMGLTPGVAVAPRVLAAIDRNADGRVSPEEIDSYARRVLHDVVLTVDDAPVALTIERVQSPAWSEMQDGVGTIRIEARTASGASTPGRHRIRFVNAHEAEYSVYLVNALLPSDPAIVVAAQRRDQLQRRVDLDVDIARTYPAVAWLLLGVGAFAALVASRGSRQFGLFGEHR